MDGTTACGDVEISLHGKRAGQLGKVVDLGVPTEQIRCDTLRCRLNWQLLQREAESDSKMMLEAGVAIRPRFQVS